MAENPPPRSAGRPKGVPNRTTTALKDAILLAAEEVGEDGNGQDGLKGYLKGLAKDEPKAFSALLGKVLPMQVTGADGGALEHLHEIRFTVVDPRDGA